MIQPIEIDPVILTKMLQKFKGTRSPSTLVKEGSDGAKSSVEYTGDYLEVDDYKPKLIEIVSPRVDINPVMKQPSVSK